MKLTRDEREQIIAQAASKMLGWADNAKEARRCAVQVVEFYEACDRQGMTFEEMLGLLAEVTEEDWWKE